MEPGATSAPTPNNIALLLHAVGTLLDYGLHLLNTVRHRSAAPSFNAIAACFGTANLSTILAHLNRGIQRAAALERLLVIRAATGRDLDVVARRTPTPPAQPAAIDAATPQPATRTPTQRASRPAGWNNPELFMSSIGDIERQIRRRPIGRTILDICLDLAVVPGFCTSEFWNELFDAMHHFGGSVATLMQHKSRRAQELAKQQDRAPGANWDWLHLKRDAARQVLGFFIGELPVAPATGPP